jgi:hypothetical protein
MAHQWLCVQPKTFYYDGIQKLAGSWEKFVEKHGDYVEKMTYFVFVIINK